MDYLFFNMFDLDIDTSSNHWDFPTVTNINKNFTNIKFEICSHCNYKANIREVQN